MNMNKFSPIFVKTCLGNTHLVEQDGRQEREAGAGVEDARHEHHAEAAVDGVAAVVEQQAKRGGRTGASRLNEMIKKKKNAAKQSKRNSEETSVKCFVDRGASSTSSRYKTLLYALI